VYKRQLCVVLMMTSSQESTLCGDAGVAFSDWTGKSRGKSTSFAPRNKVAGDPGPELVNLR
jgi:hypothetical protein